MYNSTRLAAPVLALLAALSPLAPLAPATRAAGVAAPPPAQSSQPEDSLRRGRELLKRGKGDQALPLLEMALRLYTQSNSQRGLAATHDALGDLYARQGQFSRAVPHYRDAFEKFAAADQSVDRTATTADRLTGTNTASTVAKFDDADFNSNLMLAKTGEALYRAGQVQESGSAYARMNVSRPVGAVEKAKRSGGFGGFGGLGGILSGSKPNVGAAASGAARTALSPQQNFQLYRQSILYATYELGLGRVAYHNIQLDAAQKHFQNALDVLGSSLPGIGSVGQIRRFRVAARTALGDVASRGNNPAAALKLYAEAAKGAKEDNRPDLAWPALRGAGRARLAMAAQERPGQKRVKLQEEAVASYREALQTIETVRQGTVRADEARTTFLSTTKDVFDEAAAALAELALSAGPAAGGKLEGPALAHASEAFRVVEQGRARSLLDMLSEGGAEITQGVPADLVRRKQENLEQQHRIAQELTGVSLTGEAPKESVEKLEGELEKLSIEYDSIENQIRSANPRYGSLTAAQPLALAEVQQQVLDDGTALVEYALGRESSYLWVVTKAGVALHRLPARETVEKQVAEFRDQIVPQNLRRSVVELAGQTRGLSDGRGLGLGTTASAGNAGPFVKAAHALYQTVLAPAAPLVADTRLLVVADGVLNYVPFEALVTTPEGADYSALSYLVKTNEVIYAPSASVVAAVRAQQRQPGAAQPGAGMLVVADPVFDAADARAKSVTQAADSTRNFSVVAAVADVTGAKDAPAAGYRLARLTGTRAEAEEIGKTARAAGLAPDVWLDLDASEANVAGARDISKYRILHVATHGLLNTERPQYTGVVLSLVGNRDADGFLRTDEIFNLRLGAQLVVLSACETGLGREKRGEGVIGLTRAFMYAGAPTVGVSLWAVADRSTAELMSDFYKRLLTKQSASAPAALRAAQQQMIAGKRYSAPFYWAPFVLVGDWNSRT